MKDQKDIDPVVVFVGKWFARAIAVLAAVLVLGVAAGFSWWVLGSLADVTIWAR